MPRVPYPISGYVRDKWGFAVEGVRVVIDDLTLQESGSCITNSLGEYIFDLANLVGDYLNGDKIRIIGEFLHTVDATIGSYEKDITLNPLFTRVPITEYTLSELKELRITITIEYENRVPMMNAGVNEIRDWLSGASAACPTYIAWGVGAIEPAVTDTVMESEQQRNILSATIENREARFLAILGTAEANGQALTRCALFNAALGGDMFIHAGHSTISKTSSFDIQTQISLFID